MATTSWSSRFRHDSDATFREWGLELSTRLSTVGLVQTADTGQINWTTVNRAGTGALAGYEVWRFADPLQATVPIFILIEYRTGGTTTTPELRFRVGEGSNGSGALTGIQSTTRNIMGSAGATTDTAYSSYICLVDGFLGIEHKASINNLTGSFFISRSSDSAGDETAEGLMISWGAGTAGGIGARVCHRRASPSPGALEVQVSVANAMLGFMPFAPVSTIVDGDTQVALGFMSLPRPNPIFSLCGVYTSELAPGGTFTTTLVGSTPRTFIALSTQSGPFGSISSLSVGGLAFAMLWE